MKTTIKSIYLVILAIVITLASCETNDEFQQEPGSILPEQFGVDVPSAISYEDGTSNGRYGYSSRVKEDTVNGSDIYGNLGTFIWVGDHAAEIVNDIIVGISVYNINKPMSLTFESDDDGRAKNLDVIENSNFDGQDWEFQLTITDADSEGNEDGGKALQIFWNRNPIKGIAVMKFYNLNRTEHEDAPEAMVRIDYSEAGDLDYEAQMTVSITGLPLASPLENPWAISSLKMFAGKSGDVIDVYGNSDHPNAIFISGDVGYNWAFVAAGKDSEDIGVAEVGLPSNDLDTPSRTVILKDNSIKNVLTNEIFSVWPNLPQEAVDAFLFNTEAPGFFDSEGFVQGGTSPGAQYDELQGSIEELSPFNPKEIRDLQVSFK